MSGEEVSATDAFATGTGLPGRKEIRSREGAANARSRSATRPIPSDLLILCAIRKIDIHLVTPQRDAEDTGFGPTEFDDSERRAECAIQETYRRAPRALPQRSDLVSGV